MKEFITDFKEMVKTKKFGPFYEKQVKPFFALIMKGLVGLKNLIAKYLPSLLKAIKSGFNKGVEAIKKMRQKKTDTPTPGKETQRSQPEQGGVTTGTAQETPKIAPEIPKVTPEVPTVTPTVVPPDVTSQTPITPETTPTPTAPETTPIPTSSAPETSQTTASPTPTPTPNVTPETDTNQKSPEDDKKIE